MFTLDGNYVGKFGVQGTDIGDRVVQAVLLLICMASLL